MVELRNVFKSFGDVRVLDGVSLRLERGFIYTLEGENISRDVAWHWYEVTLWI